MIFLSEKLLSRSCLLFLTVAVFSNIFVAQNGVKATAEDDEIARWADKFGEELWELAKHMTKSPEIKAKYKEYNARVELKEGTSLMASIAENVGRMLSRKMDAIRCIQVEAENVYENFEFNETESGNFTYFSSKYSPTEFNETAYSLEGHPFLEDNRNMYKTIYLDPDTHFYNIAVNTTHSSVQVPSNIYDKGAVVLEALMWSEELDKVFIQNYRTDPALSWQYFGSATGILRHYPALMWSADDPDTYDCRKRSWYIETATCSKDVVILLDNSGSMFGFRNYVAQLTIRSLMDTFSNNDFLNIIKFAEEPEFLVECFNDSLVQATRENIEVFNGAVKNVQPEDFANVTAAYEKAFELLERYRVLRRCNESATGCNQAIMLVTDGVNGNETEVFEDYNRVPYGNSSKIPVRVFTYLLGKEVTKVREIQWMACLNRGYYSHIQTLDEVQEEVLKYVDVIACPLVLQGVEHPPTWTHAFADETYLREGDDDKPTRLMIAVGVPAFDKKALRGDLDNSTKRARLLGVAGTDVPLEDIDKLTLPYKLGVNAYPFIVSNNGYVIIHPDLRPVESGELKQNYNSIDFSEVEQFDDDSDVRNPGQLLLDLRLALVNHKVGNLTNVPVKYHYDKMRRVSTERQDYFFAPLPNTPFSLGVVLPSDYGKTWIKVGDEVKRNRHMKVNISEFFMGENWKVQPDWVYCKYHYLEGHEFPTPEAELRHFLEKLNNPDWKWTEQYEVDMKSPYESDELNCGRKTLDDDAYYCNKELVELLVFDAKVTNTSYGIWKFANDYERHLIEKYNATLRFVATMSGLTRWQFVFGEVEVETDREFGDYHTYAIDETWYRSAILQHAIDHDSFVYSVPHAFDPPEDGGLKVTSSHAIFPRDGGLESPACVVGFQFSHALMLDRFFNITSEETCQGCAKTCDSEEYRCYVVDNNGYILLSEGSNDTGIFFGEVEGAVMEGLVQLNVFKKLTVYDLQGTCTKQVLDTDDASILLDPLKLISLGINWLLTELMWHLSRLSLWVEGIPFYDDEDDHDYDSRTMAPPPPQKDKKKLIHQDEDEYFKRPIEIKYKQIFFPCDKKSDLYVLQQDMFINGKDFNTAVQSNCSQPFHVKRVPKSNLLLIVINTLYPTCYRFITSSPQVINYEGKQFPCHKLLLNELPRRRLDECYTEHPEEAEYTYCGDANFIKLDLPTVILSAITVIIVRNIQHVQP